jgi:predicted enzyme related to lactoylglutathione lyase
MLSGMPEMTSYPAGCPSWVDIGVPDIQAAADFYSALFGWECPEGAPEFGGYRSCTLNGKSVAGLGPQQGPVSAWTMYVATDDTDASVGRITESGGTVMMPAMDVGTLGRMAITADPSGTTFGLWQAGDHKGAEIVNEPGAWTWSELLTRDLAPALTFYPAAFGWTANSEAMAPYTIWELDGRGIGGAMPMDDSFPPQVPSHWNQYFAVADCDASAAKVQELGGSVVTPPFDAEGVGRIALVHGLGHESFGIIAT